MIVDERRNILQLINEVKSLTRCLKNRLEDYNKLMINDSFFNEKHLLDMKINNLMQDLQDNKKEALLLLKYDILSNYDEELIAVHVLDDDSVRVYIAEWDCDLEEMKQELITHYKKLNLEVIFDEDFRNIIRFKLNLKK